MDNKAVIKIYENNKRWGFFYSNKSSIAFQLLARKVIVKMNRAIICFYIYLQ